MTIKLNGDAHVVADGTTLADLAESIGLKPQGAAAAVDYEVIPKDKWHETILSEGVELMIIHAVSGG